MSTGVRNIRGGGESIGVSGAKGEPRDFYQNDSTPREVKTVRYNSHFVLGEMKTRGPERRGAIEGEE